MAHMVERMFSFQEEPWHYSQTSDRTLILAERPKSPQEAQKLAGLSWEVQKVQLHYRFSGSTAQGEDYDEFLPAEGAFAMLRNDTQEILGMCGERYTPVQNSDLFDFAQAIMNESHEEALWETAGSLAGGRRVWSLVKLPQDFAVGKADADVVASYLLCSTSHDGSLSFSAMSTPVRVVCQNTLSAALGQSSGIFSCKHTPKAEDRIAQAKRALGLSTKYFNEFRETALRLVSTEVSSDSAKDYFAQVFPTIVREDEGIAKRHRDNDERPQRLREIAYNLWTQSPTCLVPGTEATAWSAWNAATETQEKQLLLDVQRQGRKPSQESHWNQVAFGSGLDWRKESLNLALALVA